MSSIDTAAEVIGRLFEQREREFLMSSVRVIARSHLESLEIGAIKLGRMREGESMELPRWIAEELSELNIAEIQEEPFEAEIFKALTREKMLGASQLSQLQSNFYLRMRRRLLTMKAGASTGKYRREEYEKLKATCYDLIGRRLSKLLSVSSSATLQTVGDKITPEEKVFYSSTRSFSDGWKNSLLGES